MSQDDRLDLLAHCEHLRQQLTYAIDALEGLPTMGWNTNSARDVLGEFDPSAADCRGAVEALERIARDGVRYDGSRGPLSGVAAQRVAREALNQLGGQ
jgi:hypothetical protein